MYYKGKKISRFFIRDVDNVDAPQDMLKNPEVYQAPEDPHIFLSTSQMLDMVSIVSYISERIGGYSRRIEWWAELEDNKGVLVHVENENDLSDV